MTIRDLLPLHALGALGGDEAAQVARAIAADPQLAAELAQLTDAAALIPLAVAPVAPSIDVKTRLFASIGGGRFEKFSQRMASLFDVSVDRAREILGLIERPASWEQPLPGYPLHLVHFTGGPAFATADCGFVRLAPGTPFPLHSHLGDEHTLVLSGVLIDRKTGQRIVAGEEWTQPAGVTHHDIAAGSDEVIYAALAIDGIQLAGMTGRAR